MALQFGPYAAHVLLIAVVYGSLLLVIFVAFRSGRRAHRSDGQADADAAEPLLRTEAGPAAGENADLPPLPSLDGGFDEDGGAGDDGGDGGMPPPLFAGAAADPLSRISAQLDYALTSPSVYGAKPREIIEHQQQQQQRAQAAASPFRAQAVRALEAEAVDRDVEREQLRRQEVVRKREAEKAAAAEAIMQGKGFGSAVPGKAGRGAPGPATYVAAAPLDAVYGAEPTNPAPEAAGPSASLPLSPEERIMAMHVRGRG